MKEEREVPLFLTGRCHVVTTLISVFIFSEGINIYTVLGIALIVVGVVILNLWGR